MLSDLLSAVANRLPDKEALVFNDERVSWAKFDQRVDYLAKAFLELGIRRGDRIGIICTTRPEYVYTYLAAARIGAILVGFSVLYTSPEVMRLAQLTKPTALIVLGQVKDKKLAETLKPLVKSLPFIRHFIVIGGGCPSSGLAFEELIAADRPAQTAALASRKAELDENDGVLIVFTSGSTGLPKGAVLTHKNIIDNITVQTRQFGAREIDRSLLHMPMNHVAGATEGVVPALMIGATLVCMDHFHPVHTLQMVERERITGLGQVPTMFIMELGLPNFTDFNLTSLRRVIVGGAATPPAVMEKIQNIAPDLTVLTGYGMTETTGFITYTSPEDDLDTVSRTVGKAAPEFQLRIVDDQRRLVAKGEVGEVAIRGTCVMKEYFENPLETAAAIDADGWFYTGDQGWLDRRDYLTLVGRKKEMFITGGYNVYPREIEEHISAHPKVAIVAVLGTKDDILGEVGTAHIVPRTSARLSVEELKTHCQQGLAEYKIPRHFVFREQLPLTLIGKVDKMKLRNELGGKLES